MNTTFNMDRLMTALYRATIEYNWVDKNYWKVLFYDNKAVIASECHLVEISNLPASFKPAGLFYDFQTNTWGNKLEWPISGEDIQHQIQVPRFGIFDANLPLLLHYCDSFDDEIKRKSRLVIAPHISKEDELTLSLERDETQGAYLDIDGLSFRVDANSQIRAGEVIPHIPYVCTITQQMGDTYYVNVLAQGTQIKMGLFLSNGVFWAKNQEGLNKIYDMRDVPQQFQFGAFTPVDGRMPNPVCFDTGLFVDVLKIFSLCNDKIVRFSISDVDPNIVMVENINVDGGIKIKALMGILEPTLAPQRR